MRFQVRSGIAAILFLMLIAGALSAATRHDSSGRSTKGSGNATTVLREIKDFDQIDVYIGTDLLIEIGSPAKLSVTVDDNLHDLIRTEVHGHTLKIDSEDSWSTRIGCEIRITIPSLEEIRSYGSGYVEVKDLAGELLSYQLYGSGDFFAEGTIDELEVGLYGSGNVDTRDLQAQDVYVTIGGSGNAEVMALESFTGQINGSGNIDFYGKPEHVSRRVNGSGRIRAR